jgi:hypothetical protein
MSEKAYKSAPDSLIVRELKVDGKIMITTMKCPKTYPKAALKSLYQSRWNIELDIRNIKETMGMNVLSCRTPEMAIKEIWVYLLAYNLSRLMMAQSAMLADIKPRNSSFKHCLQLWLYYIRQSQRLNDESLELFLKMMAQQRVGNRPGRVEPRAVKRRPKLYPLVMSPRVEARAVVKIHGHP